MCEHDKPIDTVEVLELLAIFWVSNAFFCCSSWDVCREFSPVDNVFSIIINTRHKAIKNRKENMITIYFLMVIISRLNPHIGNCLIVNFVITRNRKTDHTSRRKWNLPRLSTTKKYVAGPVKPAALRNYLLLAGLLPRKKNNHWRKDKECAIHEKIKKPRARKNLENFSRDEIPFISSLEAEGHYVQVKW